VDVLDVAGGKIRKLARFDDKGLSELKWLPDGHSLLVVYQDSFTRVQIGSISYPKGQFQPVTRDANRYITLTLSSDGKTLATVQGKATQSLSFIFGAGSQTKINTLALPQAQVLSTFNWANDGKLLVSDFASLVRMGINGKDRITLLGEPGSNSPSACGARYMVFSWMFRRGTNAVRVWRADADSANPVQLTEGKQDFSPVCSVDLKWVYYVNDDSQLFRVPLNGGKSELVRGSIVPNTSGIGGFDLSPDGKLAAYALTTTASTEGPADEQKIALLSLDSDRGGLQRLLNVDQRISGNVHFTPDGKAIAYPIRVNGVDNILVQPLDGSPGRQVTNFKSERISEFHWSPDGKTLGVSQFHIDSDVVLMRDKDPSSR
jgi:Tol biopolymer transport system component